MTNLTFLGAVARDGSGYSIFFLDANGCASCGDTVAEALAMGKEALEGWLEVAVDYGDPFHTPTQHDVAAVDAWLYDDDDEPGADRVQWIGMFPVEVEVPAQRATVPLRVKADLMERIAELSRVTARQIDSARFIEEAVDHEIERYRKSAA